MLKHHLPRQNDKKIFMVWGPEKTPFQLFDIQPLLHLTILKPFKWGAAPIIHRGHPDILRFDIGELGIHGVLKFTRH